MLTSLQIIDFKDILKIDSIWQGIWNVFTVATYIKLTEDNETSQFSWGDGGFILLIVYLQKEKKNQNLLKKKLIPQSKLLRCSFERNANQNHN